MPTASKGKLMTELSQTFFDYTAATDSGDQKLYTVSGKGLFSVKDGYEANVRPDGVVTGRDMLTPHATEETVSVAAFTFYLAGVLTSVAATTALAVRGASGKGKICSITATGTDTIVVVEGTDSATDALNEVRDSAGGPPYIPVGSVEIGQVRFTASGTAVVTAAEIFQTVGTHTERFDYPTWEEYPMGDGIQAASATKVNAYVEFADVIDAGTHTAAASRVVYVSGYVPVATEISNSVDFKACKNSHSVSSKQYYNATKGSKSSSLGQGGFTALVNDGITDALVGQEDENLTFWFYPNRAKLPFVITQGYLGLDPTWPADADIEVSATISAAQKSVNFAS